MSMYPCKKCLENNWRYEKLDNGFVRATCNMCEFEVEWDKQKTPVREAGAPCRKCSTPVILITLKITEKKLRNPYYFTHMFHCPKCLTNYMCEDFKVFTNKKVELPENMIENEDGTINFK